jgi:hypothetical protein
MLGSPTEEADVAVAYIQEFAIVDGDTSTNNYDSVAEELGRDPVPGLIVHTAGFDTEAGVFRIFDVWENAEVAQRFLDERLQPILDRLMAGAADDPTLRPPDREAWYDLHDEMH